ncbi:NEDD4 family-interacting protein 1-like [Exaiptasia diaphana]|uniref:NEDD4 family-interacting protein 1-like n=1 Tax=Exaiptasia diaphana TaxID=2652724 RepID=A0A913Y0L8_EXADI|nr:NEDD4 family-interacting protein 1-like [Exaiptasia diaphana]KXJ07482.1 NEDD4 family-interacting protein 1-like [Exaiptasia diaphana]
MASNQRYIAVATSEETTQDPQEVRLSVQSPPPQPISLTPNNELDEPGINQAVYVEIPPDVPPPPYDSSYNSEHYSDQEVRTNPPAYEVASKLPTYEEAEGVREIDQDLEQRNAILLDGGQEVTLGNDWIFLMCFTLAFVFNWLGFFAAYCLTRTIASRYGAIAGFGLSLVKWVLIFQEAAKDSDAPMIYGQDWLWWIFFALGWLMFIRAVLAYIYIKMLVKKGCRRFPRTWGLPTQNK